DIRPCPWPSLALDRPGINLGTLRRVPNLPRREFHEELRMHVRFRHAVLWLSPLFLGCASSSPPATPASPSGPPPVAASVTEAPPGTTAIGPPQVAWDAMTFEQRKAYMKATVFPKAKELFVAFDPVRYKEFSCATCHGDGATDGKFKMPNPKLPKLPTK